MVLVATEGLVLVGMVPAGLVMESGEKDVVRRMGWVRKKDQAACWEAGPVNLMKVWLLTSGGACWICKGTRNSGSQRSHSNRVPTLHPKDI